MRVADWDARLCALVARMKDAPYDPSRHDCLLWPAAAVKAVTGKDHGRGHRGKYRSQASAYRYLQTLGHDSPEAFLDSLFEQKPVGFARRGEIVLASDGIPAVCMGGFALSAGPEGLVRVARSDWVKCWSVP